VNLINSFTDTLFNYEIQKGEFAELRVQFISLVKHPANRRPVLVKSDTGVRFELPARLLRKDKSTRKIYGVVYEPGIIDTQGDSASAMVIERAAHEFLGLGLVKMVDFQHDFTPGKGTIVESFILNGIDDRFPNVQKGAWVVVIEVGPEMEPYIDDIGGLSLAGQGVYKSALLTNSLINSTQNTQKTTTHRTLARASTKKALARMITE
jgi:hypothetical protein